MDGEPGIDDFVCGGYVLAQPFVRGEGGPEDFVPVDVVGSPLVTASDCFAEVLPNEAWFPVWSPPVSRKEQEYQADLWGVPHEDLGGLLEWTAAREAEGRLLRDNAFADVQTPRALARKFLRPRAEIRLLGLGLLRTTVPDVLRSTAESEAATFGPNWGTPNGVLDAVERGLDFEPGGQLLGYEVLSVAIGEARHSWHCHHVERRFRDQQGIRVEPGGMLRTYADAEKVATVMNQEEVGCTVGLWRPWLIVQYRLDPPTA